jgi:polyisoprenyl-phosphate glycosyltransferase
MVDAKLNNLVGLESLRLRRNLGHQRAIAIGLSFIHAERQCDAVVIMDADGEDKPEDVPRLIETFLSEKSRKVIFAERGRRSASWTFRICYLLYRWGHRLLTGIAVKVGNFSIIPAAHVATLAVVSDTWNHYAASVFKSRIPYRMLPTSRGKRIAGDSKMNFVALVLHGLSAISVFAEIVGARLTLAILTLVGFLMALLVAVPMIRWGTDLAIPGWATTAAGLLLVIVLQMLTVALGLTILVLFNRNNLSFLPVRDYRYFIGDVQKLYERAG